MPSTPLWQCPTATSNSAHWETSEIVQRMSDRDDITRIQLFEESSILFLYLVVRVVRNLFSFHRCDIRGSYVIDDILVRLAGLERASCDVSCLGKQTARQKRQVALYQVIDRQLRKLTTNITIINSQLELRSKLQDHFAKYIYTYTFFFFSFLTSLF